MDLKIYAELFVSLATPLGLTIKFVWDKVEKKNRDLEAKMQKQIDECSQDRRELSVKIMALEASMNTDVPKWIRNADGIILFVSAEFVRLFAAPYGYKSYDLLGKKFEDLPNFSPELKHTLADLNRIALEKKYSCRSGVVITKSGRKATIIKTVVNNLSDILYIGYFVPED